MTSETQTCPSCSKQIPRRFRKCGFCGATLTEATAAPEIRRQVTIVTSDLKGSTALGERLDPESLREVLSTYFDEMRAVLETHGGTIEKIIGDAIVAVFGLATSREDDALHAVEAAAESQRALALLNDRLEERWGVRLTVRTGIATGEVVVGEASAGQHVLTGYAMGAATAMEQNAPPLEVLLAASTYEAVRGSVEAEYVDEVRAKGSDEPLAAYRLISVADRPDAERIPVGVDAAGTRTCRLCGETNPESFTSCGTCGATLSQIVMTGETRKTVTIVFADPRPTTGDGRAPSPEALRDVMSRYFTAMQQALERHGATVEKFIGDAVMAVFGLPIRHEDDALRAVRAATDMQRALPELNAAFETDWGVTLQNHIGVNTGEVVAGDASLGQRLVTGDTVNVAARLEQAAGPREILLGGLTFRLVREAVTVEEVEPLSLKGKADRVPAYRLLQANEEGEGFRRRTDAPMVGRETEIAALHQVFEEAVGARACRMATVIGDAGVGKTRLIREFSTNPPTPATVIRGRCLPYGKGITFWPLREAVRDAAGIATDDPPETALQKLRAMISDEAVVARLSSVIGLSDEQFPVPEVVWGARKFLEGLGQAQPILMIIDDIHWAEQTFLELIQDLGETIQDSPVVLLCTSRQDLLEARPEWATGPHQLRLVLRPLDEADAARVVSGLLGDAGIDGDVQARIVTAAAGNPLFVEQLLSMLIDDGSLRQAEGRWERVGDLSELQVPPTIQALVAARLDLLARPERAVIEPASVVGQIFLQEAVTELVPIPIRPEVPEYLDSIERKQLVARDAESQEAQFRFHHVLIRDAAYNGLLKRQRADLHERWVDWAEEHDLRTGRGLEFEEIQGYHLEQAYAYLSELGTLDEHARQLGIRASLKLASSGRRALGRGDAPAAVSLLRRAAATRGREEPERLGILPDLAQALRELGEFGEAGSVLEEALEIAEQTGDQRQAAKARLIQLYIQLYSGDVEGADWTSAVDAEVRRALPVFEQDDDDDGLALAWRLRAGSHGLANRYGEMASALEQVIHHAARLGDRRTETRSSFATATALLYGPTAVPEAIERCAELAERSTSDQIALSVINDQRAQLLAMRGEFDRARELYRESQARLEDLDARILAASATQDSGRVELLAGDLTAAERELRRGYDALGAFGEKFLRSTVGGLLARVLAQKGSMADAEALTHAVEEIAAADDVDAQSIWRGARARALAGRGDFETARQFGREAVSLRRQSDAPVLLAEALADLAEVERLAGDQAGADAALGEALALFERKGDIVSARRIANLSADPR
jgi:class 3 adenylate cyclase/predicted ATPase